VSLLQTLCCNRIQPKGLNICGLGLQKAKRERGWFSEPSNKELGRTNTTFVTVTPDFIRRRDRALQSVGSRWRLDFATKEIRRKPISRFQQLRQFLWREKNTVWEFYVWLRHRQAEPDAMAFPNQIDGDQIPVKGFPTKFSLSGGWTIPLDDLKYLKNGPLVSEDLKEILVPASRGWPRVLEALKQVAPIVTIASGLIAIAVNWSELVQILFPD
jgi:hypothetical protein